jgi:histidyl-tRNA synthetase
MITIDKEDKIGVDGVVAELVALELLAPELAEQARADLGGLADDGWNLTGENAPAWLDADAYAELLEIRDAVTAAAPEVPLIFSHNLVRGMGYYTGAIFEIQHPEFGYSLGGGGRYDGMIGRFAGTDAPAAGFSIGFERIVDLIPDDESDALDAIVLLHDKDVPPATLIALQTALLADGKRVRLEKRTKNVKALLARAAESGYGSVANVNAGMTSAAELEFRPLS